MLFVVGLVEMAVWALVESTVFLPMSQLVAVGAEGSSAVSFGDLFEISEKWQGVDLVEAFNDVGLEGFSLFFVRMLVLIRNEVSICSVEGEH